tara:strand:- start:456 stop:2864 length:2409 start_codon:yes stop_codon:yes gene_type:complete
MTIIGGADINGTTRTNDTRKFFRMGMPHYHNAEEPFSLLCGDSSGTQNKVIIGGGTSLGNAATDIIFNTAANDATTTGTTQMNISNSGLQIGSGARVTTINTSFSDNNTSLMTSAAINDRIESFGYTTNSGTVTQVSVGTGLDVSNATSTPSISLDLGELSDMTADVNSSEDELILLDSGDGRRKLISEIPLSAFNNDSGFVTSNTQLSTEQVQDIAGALVATGGTKTRITIDYDDTNNNMDFVVDDMNFSVSDITNATALTSGLASTDELVLSDAGVLKRMDVSVLQAYMQSNLSFTTNTNTQLSTEQVQDIVGAMFSSNTETNITATYQDSDGTIDLVANSGDITGVTAGTGLTGGGSSGGVTLNVVGGTGITANANDVAITAAQTGITSVKNTSLVVGRDNDNLINFGTDNEITFRAAGSNQIKIALNSMNPVSDNTIDLGNAFNKYRNAYFGLVDAENFRINGGQGSDGQVLTSTGSGVAWEDAAGGSGGESDASKPVVYMDSGFTDVNQTERTIPFDTEVLDPSGNASKGTDGHIKITDAGYYVVSYSIPINDDGSTLSDRTRVFAFMQTASNDAFSSNVATVAQSRSQVYTREASGGSGLSASFIYEHTANEYIRIRIDAQNNTNISTEVNQSQISIRKLSTAASDDKDFIIQCAEADQFISSTAGAGNANGFFPGYGDGERNTTQNSSGADIGFPIPKDCVLKEIYMSFGNSGSETNSSNQTVTIFKNRAASTTTFQYNASGSGGNQFSRSFTSFSGNGTTYSAGDTFNMRATGLSGYTNTQVGPVRIAVVFTET